MSNEHQTDHARRKAAILAHSVTITDWDMDRMSTTKLNKLILELTGKDWDKQ